jgi:NTP pyrophosphatase (non-canonical NTP hydrolase)
MQTDKLQELCFEEYVKNGYLALFNAEGKMGDLAELGLMLTEIAEAMEEIGLKEKKVDAEHLAEEAADIIIRALNFMSRKGLNAEVAIFKKCQKNMERPYLHGKDK